MKKLKRIFISSVQKQLAEERIAIEKCIKANKFLQQHCTPILFEKEPPPSRPSSKPYLDTLSTCDAYVLIIGNEYGHPDGSLSAIHHEYRRARELMLPIIVFIKGQSDDSKSSEVRTLINEIKNDKITYKRFTTSLELVGEALRAVEQMLKDEFMICRQVIVELPKRNAVLRRFSTEFLKHNPRETSVEDYYLWHESDSDWIESGSGLLTTMTYGEIYRFWTNRYYFPSYESKLLKFRDEGGRTKRTFVIENDTTRDLGRLRSFCRVLNRHIKLKLDPGFVPRVRRVRSLEEAKAKLGVACSMFGTINEKFAYFFIFEDQQVLMARSTHKDIVIKASNLASAYYDESYSATDFIRQYENKLPPEDAKIVDQDISQVYEWHAFE